MIYRRPVIHVVASLETFFDRLLSKTAPPSSDTDWRAKKLKEFIDRHGLHWKDEGSR